MQSRNGPPQQRKRRSQLKLRNELEARYSRPGTHRKTQKSLTDRLDAQLRQDGYAPYALLGLQDIVEAEAAIKLAEKRNRSRNTQPVEYTLAQAITNGTSLVGSVEAGTLRFHSGRNSVQAFMQTLSSDNRSRAPQQSHMALDLKTLRDAGFCEEGKRMGRILDLPGLVDECDRAVIIVDLGL